MKDSSVELLNSMNSSSDMGRGLGGAGRGAERGAGRGAGRRAGRGAGGIFWAGSRDGRGVVLGVARWGLAFGLLAWGGTYALMSTTIGADA